MLESESIAFLLGWQRRHSDSKRHRSGCGIGGSIILEGLLGFIGCRDRGIVDGNDECTQELASECVICRNAGGAGRLLEIGDVGTVGPFVLLKDEAEGRVIARDGDKEILCVLCECTQGDVKIGSCDIDRVTEIVGNWTILHTVQVLHIGGQLVEGQVGETLIEFAVVSDLDALRSRIVPLDVLECVFERSKVDAGDRVVGRLGSARSGRFDQNATSNGSKIGKVGFLASSTLDGTVGVSGHWESVFDSQGLSEAVGPKFRIEIGASEHGSDGVADPLMGLFDDAILE